MVAKLNRVNIDVEEKLPFIDKIAESFDNLIALWLFGSYAGMVHNLVYTFLMKQIQVEKVIGDR